MVQTMKFLVVMPSSLSIRIPLVLKYSPQDLSRMVTNYIKHLYMKIPIVETIEITEALLQKNGKDQIHKQFKFS